MSVSKTSPSSSGASLDVAGIVQQLMEIENRPLNAIQAKITTRTTVISDLGLIKSKVSTFQDALKAFQNPTSYSNFIASSSDSSVLNVSAGSNAIEGTYALTIDQLAQASKETIDGFSSANGSISIDPLGLEITIGGVTYNSIGTKIKSGTVATINALKASPTISDVKNWINSLGVEVLATIVPTSLDKYALVIQGTKTGEDNAVTVTGINTASSPITSPVLAQDSEFSIDGVNYSRATNSINDAISGVTLNLFKTSTATVSVSDGNDNSKGLIDQLITSYNDLIKTYKSLTANAANSNTVGTFANSPGTLIFINQIKDMFVKGITYTENGESKNLSLGSLGINLELDGSVKFDPIVYANTNINLAQSNGGSIKKILAKGVEIGFISDANNLKNLLTAYVKSGGLLETQIASEQEAVNNLKIRQNDLQDRLNSVQNNLIAQYSALNSLLFQLNNTSNSLASAFEGLVNSQRNS